MHCEEIAQATVPAELRNILIEFTVSYLMEQPTNIPDFGINFFTKMVESQKTKIVRNQEAIDEMRRLCGDYLNSQDGSVEVLEHSLEEDSFAPSLASLKDMMQRHLDDILNEEDSEPRVEYEGHSEVEDASTHRVEEQDESAHSVVDNAENAEE